MDKSDIDSGSGSGSGSDSETMTNQNIDDTVDDLMDESEDAFEEEEDMSEENESDGDNNPPSNWLGITPSSIRKQVLEIHEERKLKAKSFLNDFQGKLTLSYDWLLLGYRDHHTRRPAKHEHFTCLAAHFIDDSWKVRKWILGYTTGANIALGDVYTYHFRTAVQSFEIGSKVNAILLPNDEDFDEKTVDSIKKYMGEGEGPVCVVYCCADLFRLMVDDLCSRFRWGLYEELRMLVGWGRCFSTPNWNVTLYHYQLAVDMHKEDAFSKDEVYDDYDKPSDEEWVKIETYCKLGGCVYKVAKELFEEGGYSTCNVYFHLLAELKVMLKKEVDGGGGGESDGYFVGKAKRMLEMFDKYWNGMFLVLASACVLDPRFKMKYVEFYCSKKIDGDEGSNAETVLDYLRSLFARYAAREFCQKPICSVATVEPEEDEDDGDGDYGDGDEEADKEEKGKPDAYKDFVLFQEFLKFEGSSSPREFGESELDAYLKEAVMEWNKDFKALEWWKEKSQTYPVLSRVARDVLSIPVSRATSYDAYVTDKREPPEHVLSMDAKAANAVMCGRSWLPLIR